MKKKTDSKSMVEVRNWKKMVAKETKRLRGADLLDYYNRHARSKKQRAA